MCSTLHFYSYLFFTLCYLPFIVQSEKFLFLFFLFVLLFPFNGFYYIGKSVRKYPRNSPTKQIMCEFSFLFCICFVFTWQTYWNILSFHCSLGWVFICCRPSYKLVILLFAYLLWVQNRLCFNCFPNCMAISIYGQ